LHSKRYFCVWSRQEASYFRIHKGNEKQRNHLFSSYSNKIWDDRLDWFRKQSQDGLLGEIDEEKTRDGTIVCKDGFRGITISGNQFIELFDECGLNASIIEVDESSIFCKVIKD
jgi:2-polyprenyl-6-hydroxyphenyl methylase/3-demethylubiquinone-9 3-methyltransferase